MSAASVSTPVTRPQMVVDGAEQFVGSNSRALVAADRERSKDTKAKPRHRWRTWDHGAAQFSVHASVPSGAKFLRSWQPTRLTGGSGGENAGRTLHHTAVVRVMKDFGADAADGRELKLAGGP